MINLIVKPPLFISQGNNLKNRVIIENYNLLFIIELGGFTNETVIK